MNRYVIALQLKPPYTDNSIIYGAVVIDTKSGRVKGATSYLRDGKAFLNLAKIQCRALNKSDRNPPVQDRHVRPLPN